MTADSVPLYLALDLVLGPRVDRPIDRWAEMFIPEELARGLAAAPAGRGASANAPLGEAAPLVADRWSSTPRPGPRRAKRRRPGRAGSSWWARFSRSACFSSARGSANGAGRAVLLGRGGRRSGGSSPGSSAVSSSTSGRSPITSSPIATRTSCSARPWALALSVLGIGIGARSSRGRAEGVPRVALRAGRRARRLRAEAGPGTAQANGDLLAFFVPAWLGMTVALARVRGAAVSRRGHWRVQGLARRAGARGCEGAAFCGGCLTEAATSWMERTVVRGNGRGSQASARSRWCAGRTAGGKRTRPGPTGQEGARRGWRGRRWGCRGATRWRAFDAEAYLRPRRGGLGRTQRPKGPGRSRP